jgi:hypothetical protein
LLQNPPDIVESIHLLICCVDLLFIHMPPTERRVSVRDALGILPFLSPCICSLFVSCSVSPVRKVLGYILLVRTVDDEQR